MLDYVCMVGVAMNELTTRQRQVRNYWFHALVEAIRAFNHYSKEPTWAQMRDCFQEATRIAKRETEKPVGRLVSLNPA